MKSLILLSVFLCAAFAQMMQQQFPSDFRITQQEPIIKGKELPSGGPIPTDEKFETAVSLLIQRDLLDEKVLKSVVRHALDAIFTSNMVMLPTGDVSDLAKSTPSFNMFNTTMNRITVLLRGLNLKLRMFLTATGDNMNTFGPITSHMLEIRDFLLFTKEILDTLSIYTKRCDPTGDLTRQEGFCTQLLANDESEMSWFDGVLKDKTHKLIRNPFFFVDAQKAFVGRRTEKSSDLGILTFVTPSLAAGECHAILEQIIGLQALLRPAQLSLFQIPFASKLEAMDKKVWVFEWLPSEYWKTITFCNEMNAEKQVASVKKYIDTTIVHDRATLNFWYPFNMGAATTLAPSGH